MPERRQRTSRFSWRRLFVLLSCGIVGLVVIGSVVAGVMVYRSLVQDLPSLAELENYQSSLVTKVYDRHGELIADFFIEKRMLVALEDVPLYVRQATIAVEDSRFYAHNGIDLLGIMRALWVNLQAGEVREGASTITQQVARTLFLNRDRTLRRKLREAILARRIEQHFHKDDILRMYMNQIFYGHNAYGVEAAAQIYFGKSAKDLTLAQGALIAGLPQAPNKYSPLKNLDLALQRRAHVLRRMVVEGYLTPEEAHLAEQEPIHLQANYQQVNKAPYFVEYVRQYLEEHYGVEALYRGGFEVHLTLDLGLQRLAEQAIRYGVLAVDKRHGYQGPHRRLELTEDMLTNTQLLETVTRPADGDMTVHEGETLSGVVLEVEDAAVRVAVKDSQGVLTPEESFAWVREPDVQQEFQERRRLEAHEIFQRGDVIRVQVLRVDPAGRAHLLTLEQEPLTQGALIAMEPSSGHVLAMVGGYDFDSSQFNRATQALRQPGSAFKPIIYAAALEAGLTPATIIYDAPIVEVGANDQEYWKPQNYSQKFYGPTTLRTALTHSRNLVTIRLLDKIGIPAVLSYAKRLGIDRELTPDLSLALGSSGVTLLELTTAYGVFATGGMYVPPVFITKIVDANQHVLEEHLPQARRAVSPELAYVMTNLLQGVIQQGTGRSMRILGRPVAGKTGTTNDFRDAWFLGYTPNLLTSVWVGIDDRSVLGHQETGARAAGPIWLEFMRGAIQDEPITDFAVPRGIRFFHIEAASGKQATASTRTETLFEAFMEGSAPEEVTSPSHDLHRDIYRLDRERHSAARR
jgi:penicillin-binding protein 1A